MPPPVYPPGDLVVAEAHGEEEVPLALAEEALADDPLVLRDPHLLAHAELGQEDQVPRVPLWNKKKSGERGHPEYCRVGWDIGMVLVAKLLCTGDSNERDLGSVGC